MSEKPENFNNEYRPGTHLQNVMARRAHRAEPSEEQLANERKHRDWEFGQYKANREVADAIPGDMYSTLDSLDYEVNVNADCLRNGCTGFYRHDDGTHRSGYWQQADGTAATDPKQVDGMPFFKGLM